MMGLPASSSTRPTGCLSGRGDSNPSKDLWLEIRTRNDNPASPLGAIVNPEPTLSTSRITISVHTRRARLIAQSNQRPRNSLQLTYNHLFTRLAIRMILTWQDNPNGSRVSSIPRRERSSPAFTGVRPPTVSSISRTARSTGSAHDQPPINLSIPVMV